MHSDGQSSGCTWPGGLAATNRSVASAPADESRRCWILSPSKWGKRWDRIRAAWNAVRGSGAQAVNQQAHHAIRVSLANLKRQYLVLTHSPTHARGSERKRGVWGTGSIDLPLLPHKWRSIASRVLSVKDDPSNVSPADIFSSSTPLDLHIPKAF